MSKLYTVTVFTENRVGLLNQISIIFTRRCLNIESLSVSPSSIPGIHKFTITVWSDHSTIAKVTKQIEKRIEVLRGMNTDNARKLPAAALQRLQRLFRGGRVTAAVNEIRIVSVRQVYADLCRTLEIIAARSSLHQFIHKTASFGNIIAVRAAFCKKNRQP